MSYLDNVRVFVRVVELGTLSAVNDAVVLSWSCHSIIPLPLRLGRTRRKCSGGLLESIAEGFEIRPQKSNVSTHHAEMRNLLSLDPKVHGLRADAKKTRRIAHSYRVFR